MLNLFYRALNSEKGFTLIEVLVVVAIIGILAALAAPLVLGRIEDARISNDEAMARQLTSAVEQWYIDMELDVDNDPDISSLTGGDLHDYLDKAAQEFVGTGAISAGDTWDGQSKGHIEAETSTQGEADTIIFVYVPEGGGDDD